ncbi:MAG TPA: M20/M25/M40 family metallo-hydrolase [Candidatus Acidoferrales bacterium]|nr:M20/M25/M40 family metallo-hydrolase [Candidatus Acidoferrales bacterium]
MSDFASVDRYLEQHLDASLAELSRYAAQPSIAAQGVGMAECAALTAEMLRRRGFAVEVMPSDGAPVVVADRDGRSDRTLIVYNHYDVQPAEPLELWTSPPFEPARRDGKLFGRGVSDDKGHLTSRLLAIDALLDRDGELPCRIKWLVEGEEEVGSVHLPAFVHQHRERLAADACLWEFGSVDHRGVPISFAGLRGICYVELSVETASDDVHSGIGGSIFPNAAWRLVWALASLKGPDERIRIPGHYDPVQPPTARDRELFAAMPDVAEPYREQYGVASFLRGLTGGVELKLAEVFEPTCTICGITTGYQGRGSKTVMPARASAKVDFRLVPDQTPKQVLRNLRAHLDQQGFADVKIEFLGGNPAGRTDPDHPFLALAARTAREAFGVPMQIVPMVGGSGPNHCFIEELGVPIVCAGCGYPGTRAHAPDENVREDLYLAHAKHVARLVKAFGAGE